MVNNTEIDESATSQRKNRGKRFMVWARRQRLGPRYEITLTILAIISAFASFYLLSTHKSPFDLTGGSTVTVIFTLNLVLLLLLGVSVGRWFVRIWSARKTGEAAARLHVRITAVFMAIAIVPPIAMAIFSAIVLETGLQTWFGERVKDTVDNSLQVARSYIAENRRTIESDVTYLASIFSQNASASTADLKAAAQEAVFQRALNELLIIELPLNGAPLVIIRANQGLSLGSGTTALPRDAVAKVQEQGTYLATNSGDDTFIAIRRLSGFLKPTYLYIARELNPLILEQYAKTVDAVETFNELETQQGDFQLQFSLLYLFISILILLAAIWTGLWFSSRLVDPLSNLVNAAQRFGKGDLSARAPASRSSDELGNLVRAFNKMAEQLEASRQELLRANVALDERRRFVEEVLENVSAGVIGLNADGTVFLPNKSACRLLNLGLADMVGLPLVEVLPPFADLLRQSAESKAGVADSHITMEVGDETRNLLVRIACERKEGELKPDGFVVTFDDITDQLSNQRTAAWADVARRIAHEIKNPLTPIQLSAERLKRRYRKDLPEEDTVFDQCTNTIVRQVGDLRRMVDEFSSFARMPAPLFRETDYTDLLRQAIFLQEVANPDINFVVNTPQNTVMAPGDGRLIGQALTNILKNAVEGVARLSEEERNLPNHKGTIIADLIAEEERIDFIIHDNGVGLPEGQRERLLDPYVTTREKGTGLGLAIVKRIMEEHGGRVKLAPNAPRGAQVTLSFSRKSLNDRQAAAEAVATAAE